MKAHSVHQLRCSVGDDCTVQATLTEEREPQPQDGPHPQLTDVLDFLEQYGGNDSFLMSLQDQMPDLSHPQVERVYIHSTQFQKWRNGHIEADPAETEGDHPLTSEVTAYVEQYAGDSPFLCDLKDWLGEKPLTPGQVAAVTNNNAFQRWLSGARSKLALTPPADVVPVARSADDLPF